MPNWVKLVPYGMQLKKLSLLIPVLFMLLTGYSQSSIAIRCGQVLNVQTGKLLTQQVILVKNQRIVSVIPANQFTEKTDTVVDLSNYTILPGLIDCHTHVLLQGDITSEDYDAQILKESIAYRTIRAVNSCRQSLLNGFTTIRDLGTEGAGYADVDLKKAINREEIPGPRMQVATLALNTTGHYPIKSSEYASELTMRCQKGCRKLQAQMKQEELLASKLKEEPIGLRFMPTVDIINYPTVHSEACLILLPMKLWRWAMKPCEVVKNWHRMPLPAMESSPLFRQVPQA